jgi:hypothetical protein
MEYMNHTTILTLELATAIAAITIMIAGINIRPSLQEAHAQLVNLGQSGSLGQHVTGFADHSFANNPAITTDPSTISLTGPRDPPGPTLVITQRSGNSAVIDPNSFRSVLAICNPGEEVTGGGFHFEALSAHPPYIVDSTKTTSAGKNGWEVTAFNPGTDPNAVAALASCASLVP